MLLPPPFCSPQCSTILRGMPALQPTNDEWYSIHGPCACPQSKGCRKRQQSRGGDHLGLSAAGLHPNRKQVLLTPEPQSLSESGPGGPRMSQLQTFPLDKDAQVPFQIHESTLEESWRSFCTQTLPAFNVGSGGKPGKAGIPSRVEPVLRAYFNPNRFT